MDPRLRHTTWTVVIGSSFFNLALYSANQAQVQRYLSCRTLKSAKIAIAINYLGMVLLLGLAVLCGIVMYGYYHDCDPLSVGDKVTRSDQLMPYMVMEIFGQIPGMTGLFTAAVFSGSLSTISTSITAMSSVTVQDLLKPFVKISEEQLTMLSRSELIKMSLSFLTACEKYSRFLRKLNHFDKAQAPYHDILCLTVFKAVLFVA